MLGNNFFGDELCDKLEEIRETVEREGFILMDRVQPPPQVCGEAGREGG